MLINILLALVLVVCAANCIMLSRFHNEYDRWLAMLEWWQKTLWHPAQDTTDAFERWKQQQQQEAKLRAPSSNG